MLRHFLLVFFYFCLGFTSGQIHDDGCHEIIFKDASDSMIVVNVTVNSLDKSFGKLSNNEGVIQFCDVNKIEFPLHISHLSYLSDTILSVNSDTTIYLISQVYDLGAAEISSISLNKILKSAKKNFRDNTHYDDHFCYKAYYRVVKDNVITDMYLIGDQPINHALNVEILNCRQRSLNEKQINNSEENPLERLFYSIELDYRFPVEYWKKKYRDDLQLLGLTSIDSTFYYKIAYKESITFFINQKDYNISICQDNTSNKENYLEYQNYQGKYVPKYVFSQRGKDYELLIVTEASFEKDCNINNTFSYRLRSDDNKSYLISGWNEDEFWALDPITTLQKEMKLNMAFFKK